MNRVISLTAALMVLVAAFAVIDQSQAEARGLFNRDKCCKPAKKCRTPRRSQNECCEPAAASCCETAPACGTASYGTASYIEATPAYGYSTAIATSSCGGCETQVASCGSCDLSRRELRKARKNCCDVQTCGYETQGCNSCSAPVSTCGSSCGSCGGGQVIQQGAVIEGCSSCGGGQIIQGAVVEGCSDCGSAAVEAPTPAIEAAPEAPAAEEAAPEAPAEDSTT